MLPHVEHEEAYWGMKLKALEDQHLKDEPDYKPIEMPRNSPTGFLTAFFSTFTGFGLIWHIWWMVILGLVCAFATFVLFAWRDEGEYEIAAETVASADRAVRELHRKQLRNARRDR